MVLTPLGSVVGGGIPSLSSPVGDATTVMGCLLFGLLAVTTLVILIAGRRAS